jgi:hypothetical protein
MKQRLLMTFKLANQPGIVLEQQRSTEASDDSADDDVPNRNLTTRVSTEGINKIMDVLDLLTENDTDFDRSTTVKRVVVDVISCYKELLREQKLRARQSTLSLLQEGGCATTWPIFPPVTLLSQRCQVGTLTYFNFSLIIIHLTIQNVFIKSY